MTVGGVLRSTALLFGLRRQLRFAGRPLAVGRWAENSIMTALLGSQEQVLFSELLPPVDSSCSTPQQTLLKHGCKGSRLGVNMSTYVNSS